LYPNSIIQTWLAEGRLEDFRDEFLVEIVLMPNRPPDGSAAGEKAAPPPPLDGAGKETTAALDDGGAAALDDDFWTGGFRLRAYASALSAEGIPRAAAALWDALMPRIFQAGKSVEILARLNRLTTCAAGTTEYFTSGVDAENNNNRRPVVGAAQLYEEFVAGIRQRLPPRLPEHSMDEGAAAVSADDKTARHKKLEPQFQAGLWVDIRILEAAGSRQTKKKKMKKM
jgi:hypothetical protein